MSWSCGGVPICCLPAHLGISQAGAAGAAAGAGLLLAGQRSPAAAHQQQPHMQLPQLQPNKWQERVADADTAAAFEHALHPRQAGRVASAGAAVSAAAGASPGMATGVFAGAGRGLAPLSAGITLLPPPPPPGPLAASCLPCSSSLLHCSSSSTPQQQLLPSSLVAAGPRPLCQAVQDAQSSSFRNSSSCCRSTGTRCPETLTQTPKCSIGPLHGWH